MRTARRAAPLILGAALCLLAGCGADDAELSEAPPESGEIVEDTTDADASAPTPEVVDAGTEADDTVPIDAPLETGPDNDDGDPPDAEDGKAQPPDTAEVTVGPPKDTVPAGACGEAVELITCESTTSSHTGPGATGQVVDSTQCNPFFYPATEVTYRWVSPGDGKLAVTILSDETIDVLILSEAANGGCDPELCLGWTPWQTDVTVSAGDVLYLIADGYQGAKGAFDLVLDCSEIVVKPPSCEPQALIGCGDNLLVKEGGTQKIASWGCGQTGLDGPERAFTFQAPATGPVTVTVGDGDGVVIVLEGKQGCNPDACLASDGTNSITFDAAEGETYELVVDTEVDFEGSLSVEVSCVGGD